MRAEMCGETLSNVVQLTGLEPTLASGEKCEKGVRVFQQKIKMIKISLFSVKLLTRAHIVRFG